jgi:hypothetical protein
MVLMAALPAVMTVCYRQRITGIISIAVLALCSSSDASATLHWSLWIVLMIVKADDRAL